MSDYIEPDVPLKPSSNGTGGANGTPAYSEHAPSTGIVPDTGSTSERGTLDESVYETLRRDISNINTTLKKVVYPHFPSGRLTSGRSPYRPVTKKPNFNNCQTPKIYPNTATSGPHCSSSSYTRSSSHTQRQYSRVSLCSRGRFFW